MSRADIHFSRAVEAAVERIEGRTDAEIVVVAAGRSGCYADLAWAGGAAVAWLLLAVALWSPVPFAGSWLPVEIPLAGLLAGLLIRRSPPLLRLLSTSTRRRRQVEAESHRVFHEEVVHGTKRRTGVLVYLSHLERRVRVVPDAGVEARVPPGEIHAIRWGEAGDPATCTDTAGFLAGLEALGELLARRVPALDDDNPDEIANAPRFRP